MLADLGGSHPEEVEEGIDSSALFDRLLDGLFDVLLEKVLRGVGLAWRVEGGRRNGGGEGRWSRLGSCVGWGRAGGEFSRPAVVLPLQDSVELLVLSINLLPQVPVLPLLGVHVLLPSVPFVLELGILFSPVPFSGDTLSLESHFLLGHPFEPPLEVVVDPLEGGEPLVLGGDEAGVALQLLNIVGDEALKEGGGYARGVKGGEGGGLLLEVADAAAVTPVPAATEGIAGPDLGRSDGLARGARGTVELIVRVVLVLVLVLVLLLLLLLLLVLVLQGVHAGG